MKILVTGAAGFIGFYVCKRLLEDGFSVIGYDNLNAYYDISLKQSRLNEIHNYSKKYRKKFFFFKYNINDISSIRKIFKKFNFEKVFHLAAQAGVRNSIKNPYDYFSTNLFGASAIL